MDCQLGIVGNGFVGQATKALASSRTVLVVYDRDPGKCEPRGTTWDDISRCDVVMVSVPTPMGSDGRCSTRLVDSVLHEVRSRNDTTYIIIRSTVPVGYCESRNVFFMPEFLTEAGWSEDFRTNPLWIVGVDGHHPELARVLQDIFRTAKEEGHIASDSLKFMTTKEAEAVKYFRNCFLATKVSFCNEFYEFCVSHGIEYGNVATIAASDARIQTSHTRVPGPDGQRGFGGTCFPKDMASLVYQFAQQQVASPLLSAAVHRNLERDRPQRDWEADVGRAVEEVTVDKP